MERNMMSVLMKECHRHSSQRAIPIDIPAGNYLLRGMAHDYLCRVVKRYPLRGQIYIHTIVTDCYPHEDIHIGERHNLLLNKNDNRQEIVILSH